MKVVAKLVLIVLCGIGSTSNAQTDHERRLTQKPISCEYLQASFDYALLDTRKVEGSYLVMVFHPGTRERSTSYSRRRAKIIERYFTSRLADTKFLVIAQGKPRQGLGTLEIFVGGKLKEEVAFARNKGRRGQCIE